MKVLLINGSPNEKGCTYTALYEIAKELEKNGIDHELVQIGKGPVHGCTACAGCRKNGGRCVFNDDIANKIIDKMRESDAVVVGSPVYYAGISGGLKAVLDRVFYAAGSGFKNKLAASVVSCRRGGASAAFDQLNHYFEMSNMHLVGSQYWNQVHGTGAEEVKQDLEGLQTMRTLGKNMSWLLKCIEQGKAHGVPQPEYEKWLKTNFIR